MFALTVSGNLAAPPKPVFSNSTGQVYNVRFGSSTFRIENKQMIPVTIWCSGLIGEKKIKSILSRIQKGTYVIAVSPDATIRTYQGQDGTTKFEMDLKYIHSLEAGNLPKEDSNGYQNPINGASGYQNQNQIQNQVPNQNQNQNWNPPPPPQGSTHFPGDPNGLPFSQ